MIDGRRKIEPHAHTSEVSECGRLSARKLMRLCGQAGYDAVVITDHLYTGWKDKLPEEKRVEAYLSGYRAARKAGARESVTALLGVEARISRVGDEDYLIYGVREEDIAPLMRAIDAAHSLEDLTGAVHNLGLLIVQAHPFRPWLRPMPYQTLDGIEAFNGNPRQQNNNDQALAHARRCGRLMTSGSDVHREVDIGRGGVLVPDWVVDNASLLEYFGDYPQLTRIETDEKGNTALVD